jgi:hypothetical protein
VQFGQRQGGVGPAATPPQAGGQPGDDGDRVAAAQEGERVPAAGPSAASWV